VKEVNAMATGTRRAGGKSSAKTSRRGSSSRAAGASARGGKSTAGARSSAASSRRGKSQSGRRAGARASGGRSDQSRKTARGAARASGRTTAGRAGKSAGGGSRSRAGGGGSRATVDHEQIRRWAEERRGQPSCVRGTGGGGDIGMLRIDFPGFSGEGSLQPISWDDFFDKFDERGLALIYQDTTRGQKSKFNKLVSRDDPKVRKQMQAAATAGRGR
jgi:hypothetical protein